MDQSRSQRIVLLLDCCYSGAFAAGLKRWKRLWAVDGYGIYWPVTIREDRSARRDKPWISCVTATLTLKFGRPPTRHCAEFPVGLALLLIDVNSVPGW
jgi:hypothetical protein